MRLVFDFDLSLMHFPVLVNEVTELLNLRTCVSLIDGTAGSGGHIKAALQINPKIRILGIDLDQANIDSLEQDLEIINNRQRVIMVQGNYKNVDEIAKANHFENTASILIDLGFSSVQLEAGRGLSFQKDEKLDMRYDRKAPLTAEQVINVYDEEKLGRIFKDYGEEKFATRIVRNIVARRNKSKITHTFELAELIKQALPGNVKHKANDSIRRVFQAIRIEVNHELENLNTALPKCFQLLSKKGRLGIISFHSLECRIVKQFFLILDSGCICPPQFPVCICGKKTEAKIITKKPVTATEEEITLNSRSKPAKLRVAEKIV